MKFPKLSVISKIVCASAVSSYFVYEYTKNKPEIIKNEIIATPTPTPISNLICPTEKAIYPVTGNWKMNGSKKTADDILKLLRCANIERVHLILGIPAPYLDYVQQRKPKFVNVAGQNIYKEASGIYTGETSGEMLLDIGVKWVILGASERRIFFNEDYDLIGEKAKYAVDRNINIVLCVGETAEEREQNKQVEVVRQQLDKVLQYVEGKLWKNIIIAYEPLWAVSSTRTSTPEEAQEVAAAIRQWLAEKIPDLVSIIKIQYGGPITANTARSYLEKKDIDGFYVGRSSLKPDFIKILTANVREQR